MFTCKLFEGHALATAAATAALSLGLAGAAQAASPASFGRVVGHSAAFNATAPALLSGLNASDIVIGLTGIQSFDRLGDAINTLLVLDAMPGALVDQLNWSLNLATIGSSWLSEAGVIITNANGDGVYFNPGFGDDAPGTQAYADGGSLVGLGIGFNVLADGKLFVEFYEDWDDNPLAADASYLSGSITLAGIAAAIPEPGTYGLMALGLLGVALHARRRLG